MLDGPTGGKIDEDGVDLDDLSGHGGLEAPGQASCMAIEADQAEAAAAGLAAQCRDRHDEAPVHQASEDAADRRGGDGDALPLQQPGKLLLAPHWVVGTQFLHRLRQCSAPLRQAGPSRPPREGFGAFGPAVERSA